MKTLAIIVLLLTFGSVVNAATLPDFPMSFWGSATIDGAEAPVGAVIRVYDANLTSVGEVSVIESGIYGYTEPTKQKLVIGSGDGSLSFTIQAATINSGIETSGTVPVTYSEGFVSGEAVNKNLSFVVTVATETPRSSGGGGGGGKSVKQVPKPMETVAGITSTTSSSTDQEHKTALQKQLIALLLQLIELLKLQIK